MNNRWKKGNGDAYRFAVSLVGHRGDECVSWPYSRTRGYGVFTVNRKGHYAHRWLCEQTHGPAPSAKHHAAHSCGKGDRGCVNPRHISWKTPAENMRDKELHGTTRPKGFPRYKLTPEQVAEIRALSGLTIAVMAARYGVSESNIRKIRSGQNWPAGTHTHARRPIKAMVAFTPEERAAIKAAHGRRPRREIAAEYGVSETTIFRIVHTD